MGYCLCDTREQHPVSECVVPGVATAVVIHDDIRAILLALGLSDHARPYSMHAVVHRDILPAIAEGAAMTRLLRLCVDREADR